MSQKENMFYMENQLKSDTRSDTVIRLDEPRQSNR